jgi:hypothetical protein
MKIVGISGLAGSGKDTAADVLRKEFGFRRVSMADPFKRACQDWFGWTHEQLWGPSELRSVPDPRYGGLTPRKALQLLGSDWGRACYENIWVDIALRTAKEMLSGGLGELNIPCGVVIPDVRFKNEADAIRAAGGSLWLIERPGAGLTGEAASHASEAGLDRGLFDAIINNHRSREDFKEDVAMLAQIVWGNR